MVLHELIGTWEKSEVTNNYVSFLIWLKAW